MTPELWKIYLRLQTELAYGTHVANAPAAATQHTGGVPNLLQKHLGDKGVASIKRSLIVGPGGVGEVNAFRNSLPGELHILTAHDPELAELAALDPKLKLHAGDIHDMPFPNNFFNFMYTANVLEHCFAPYIALMETRRVLVPGGHALHILPSFPGKEGGKGPFHLHCLTWDVWFELLRKTGLRVVEHFTVTGDIHPEVSYLNVLCASGIPPYPHIRILKDLMMFKKDYKV